MSDRPIVLRWDGVDFAPVGPRWLAVCRKEFGDGEIITFVQQEERSPESHRHLFACIRETWINLPERLADEYPNPQALRTAVTIKAGHCTVTKLVCASPRDAIAAAAMFNMDPYVIAEVNGRTVTAWRAKTIRVRGPGAVKKREFQVLKEKMLHELAQLIEVDPAALSRQAEAA